MRYDLGVLKEKNQYIVNNLAANIDSIKPLK